MSPKTKTLSPEKPSPGYLAVILTLMLGLPLLSIVLDGLLSTESANLWAVMGKWFVFWALGVRLAMAGVVQIRRPQFTVQKIFGVDHVESHHFVRELGFANLSLGVLAILSLPIPELRLGAALAGGLFMGLAGLYHALKKPASGNEWLAMLTDLMIAALMAVYLLSQIG